MTANRDTLAQSIRIRVEYTESLERERARPADWLIMGVLGVGILIVGLPGVHSRASHPNIDAIGVLALASYGIAKTVRGSRGLMGEMLLPLRLRHIVPKLIADRSPSREHAVAVAGLLLVTRSPALRSMLGSAVCGRLAEACEGMPAEDRGRVLGRILYAATREPQFGYPSPPLVAEALDVVRSLVAVDLSSDVATLERRGYLPEYRAMARECAACLDEAKRRASASSTLLRAHTEAPMVDGNALLRAGCARDDAGGPPTH